MKHLHLAAMILLFPVWFPMFILTLSFSIANAAVQTFWVGP